MTLYELRQAVIDHIKTVMPDLRAVDAHPGRFNLNELKRVGTKLPAVKVAILGVPNVESAQTGERELVVRLAAFVITRDARRLPKDDAALAIVEALMSVIPNQKWGLANALRTSSVRAENLFSGQVDAKGVALWAVSWEQRLRIGENAWRDENGVLPTEVYLNDDPDTFGEEPRYERVD